MRRPTPAVLASAYTRLAPVLSASLACGAYGLHVVFSRDPGADATSAVIDWRGTNVEAHQEASTIFEAASALGFRLQAIVIDASDGPIDTPAHCKVISLTWNRRSTPTSPSRPVAEAAV